MSISSINLTIKPNSKKNALLGWKNDRLVISISAPAIDGRANKELVHYLSKILMCAKSKIKILKGEKSKHKTLEFSDIDIEKLFIGRQEGLL